MSNTLLLHYYGEQEWYDHVLTSVELDENEDLAHEYAELSQAIESLPTMNFSPSESVLQNILRYSAAQPMMA